MPIYNTLIETMNILLEYFIKIPACQLKYFLDIQSTETLKNFLNENICDINITYVEFLNKHIKFVKNKIYYLTNYLNSTRYDIKLSIVSDKVYNKNIFVIKDTLFIKNNYLEEIFNKSENNKYNLDLLKNISVNYYSIVQLYNLVNWQEYIYDKYHCAFININNIIFKNSYNIAFDTNTNFENNSIVIYLLNEEIYGVFNNIISDFPYPQCNKICIKLKYYFGKYIEEMILDKYNLHENPYIDKAVILTNSIIF